MPAVTVPISEEELDALFEFETSGLFEICALVGETPFPEEPEEDASEEEDTSDEEEALFNVYYLGQEDATPAEQASFDAYEEVCDDVEMPEDPEMCTKDEDKFTVAQLNTFTCSDILCITHFHHYWGPLSITHFLLLYYGIADRADPRTLDEVAEFVEQHKHHATTPFQFLQALCGEDRIDIIMRDCILYE